MMNHVSFADTGYGQWPAAARVRPFYLVLDVSYSMLHEMTALNAGLHRLHQAVRMDPVLDAAAQLCVMTFSDTAKVVMPLARASANRLPPLSVEGGTNYGAAFRELSEVIPRDILELERQGYRPENPFCFFVADGEPVDGDWLETFTRAMALVSAGGQPGTRPVFIPWGFRDAPPDVLRRLAYPPDEGRWYLLGPRSDRTRPAPSSLASWHGTAEERRRESAEAVDQIIAGVLYIIQDTIRDSIPTGVPVSPAPAVTEGRSLAVARHDDRGSAQGRSSGSPASPSLTRPSERLEIGVSHGAAGIYQVTTRSSAGEAPVTLTQFPFDRNDLDRRLISAELAVTRTAADFRRVPAHGEEPARQLGADLFNFLFPAEVREHLNTMRAHAARSGSPLQVQLRIRPPELAALPWEFLYDSSRDDYLALSMPLTRHLEVPEPIRPLTIRGPLRILGMVSLPRALGDLDVDQEKERVTQALAALQSSGHVTLRWVAGQTWRDLRDALEESEWHIVHFIGHGGFDALSGEGFLALADEHGQIYRLAASDLGLLLADNKSLGLVTLNSCDTARADAGDIFSSTAALLMRRGIPSVVAMQYPMSDRAAVIFSRGLYEAIARGIPVDQAVTRARRDIKLSIANSLEWATPVLYLRSDTASIFATGRTSAGQA
jgi:uncharacterized protein YegL